MNTNNITGDRLISKVNNKAFDVMYDKIFYPCLPNCAYLINTLTKCKFCPHKEVLEAETRIDIIGSNGNEGLHYE